MDKTRHKRNKFETFTEIAGWLQIAASPTLVGLVVSSLVYFPNPTTLKLVIAIAIAIAGVVTGILWACRIWKKRGTINFISRADATPELDSKEQD